MTTFREFQASRTHGDVSKTYGDESEPVTGFTYLDGLQIADIDDSLGKHWLLISNLERVSDDLEALERMLWTDTRMQSDILAGDDLEAFARGYFELIGKRYDRDLCAIALSSSKPLAVRDIQEALDRVWSHPLYAERLASLKAQSAAISKQLERRP